MKALVKQSQPVADKIKKITKVKGLSFLSIVTILAETDGFNIILNQKQLIGYSGLDVRIEQSGEKNIKGRITKKGNSHLRKALYMPALCACRTNKAMKLFYTQLNERQKAKKQGGNRCAKKASPGHLFPLEDRTRLFRKLCLIYLLFITA